MIKGKIDTDTRKKILLCVNVSLGKKAKNLIILNVKEISSVTDYYIICSGTSDRQVQAIASSIQEDLKKKAGIMPLGVEGENIGKWVLLDYNDFIVHIFYEPIRMFYDIERLWPDTPRMEIDENIVELTSLDKGM